MAAIQKIAHLKVTGTLTIGGTQITPVETPLDLPDKPTIEDLANAHEALLAHLAAAGIFTPQNAPQDA